MIRSGNARRQRRLPVSQGHSEGQFVGNPRGACFDPWDRLRVRDFE